MTIPMLIPKELGLPSKYTSWRPDQADSVDKIIDSGKTFFMLDAPVGSGKSLVAVATYKRLVPAAGVMDRLTGKETKYRCIYLTRTKQLQEQLINDFDEARMIKGRSNYWCTGLNTMIPLTCDECPGKKCEDCPYTRAKNAAVNAPLAVLNDDYFLTEANGPGRFSGGNMVIVDEVDSIESQLLNFIEFTVSERQCKKYALDPPHNKENLKEWLGWTESATAQVKWVAAELARKLPEDTETWIKKDIQTNKEFKQAQNFLHKMDMFRVMVNNDWLTTVGSDAKNGWKVSFRPVTVGEYAANYLWRHGERFLCMSGTILDPEIMAEDLGIPAGDYEYRRLDSKIPVSQRPIYYRPVANLASDSMDTEMPKLVPEIVKIANRFPSDNILIHTTSTKIRDYLMNNLPLADRLMTHDQINRVDQLELFKQQRGRIMLSFSFDRGVDLPDDQCLVPGTLVRTLKGYKPVEQIQIGDNVLTHKGRFRKVERVMNRDINEEIVDIETYGGIHHQLTANHPVLTWGGWKPAGELAAGDVLKYPVSKWRHGSKPLGRRFITGHRNTSHVGQNWESTPDFWWLVGLWAAEGNITVSHKTDSRRAIYEVVFNLGLDEKDTLARKACILIERVLGNVMPEPYPILDRNGCRVSFKNAPFALWLIKNVGRGSHNKKVPTRLFYSEPEACQQAFLDGLFDGDGYIKGKYNTLSVVSRELALGARDLLLSLGQAASFGIKKNCFQTFYTLDSSKKYARFTERNFISKVRSVKRVLYQGPVYNFAVDRDESYSLVGLCVHNCRCVIICKMPYLHLGDKQVKARLARPKGQRWYNLKAIQTVMQMTGRAVRGEKDFAETYILDRKFDSLLARTRHLIPQWWLEAIIR